VFPCFSRCKEKKFAFVLLFVTEAIHSVFLHMSLILHDMFVCSLLAQTRPTPAHLTSVQAEQILAQACENESHNAKRMRLGLEPVSQPLPLLPSTTVSTGVDIKYIQCELRCLKYLYKTSSFFICTYVESEVVPVHN
jgi:hypothetical protein